MPLQDMPHTFSCMHSWQIINPQRQRQQKGTSFPQQWQVSGLSAAGETGVPAGLECRSWHIGNG
jgi:hypothetical protein